MNNIRNIESITEQELNAGIFGGLTKGSWHEEYSASAWVFLGGFPFELSEGDIICVMSQWGEIEDINLVRDKVTNKSKGFAFIKYEDNRSTILAVDNFNGMKLLGRTLRCDHVQEYKLPKDVREKEMEALDENPESKVSIGPGHAYKSSELATEHDVVQGVDLWRQPKPTAVAIPSSSVNSAADKEDGPKRSKKNKKEHREKKSKHKKEKSEKRHRSEKEDKGGESSKSKRVKYEGNINIKEEVLVRGDDSRASDGSRHKDRDQDRHRERDSIRDREFDRFRDSNRDRDYDRHKDSSRDRSRNRGQRRDSRDRSRDRDHKDRRRDSSKDRSRTGQVVDTRADLAQAATRGGGVISERNTNSAVSRAPLPFVPSGAVASWRGNRDPNVGLAATTGSSGGHQMAMMGGRRPLAGPGGSSTAAESSGSGAARKDPSVSGIGGFSRVR